MSGFQIRCRYPACDKVSTREYCDEHQNPCPECGNKPLESGHCYCRVFKTTRRDAKPYEGETIFSRIGSFSRDTPIAIPAVIGVLAVLGGGLINASRQPKPEVRVVNPVTFQGGPDGIVPGKRLTEKDVRELQNNLQHMMRNQQAEYLRRARYWASNNALDKALADYEEFIRLAPENPAGYDGRAWLRATATDGKFRDGKLAVADAMKACELSEWNEAIYLNTLAAAHAEAGEFDDAVNWATKAVELAAEDKKDDYAQRLELYNAGKPYRDEASSKTSPDLPVPGDP